ncbi:MAG: hypothetical protein D6735_11550, partial [Acidobacteria bacterium]
MPRSRKHEAPKQQETKKFLALSGDLNLASPGGASQYSDNMRRITTAINELQKAIEQKPAEESVPPAPQIVSIDGGGGGGEGGGEGESLYVFHNIGGAPGESWARTTKSGNTYHVYFRTIRGINGISVWTNYDEDVIYVSGSELQVHAAYGNLTGTFSIEDMANTEIPGYQWGLPNWRVAPITVYKSRQ